MKKQIIILASVGLIIIAALSVYYFKAINRPREAVPATGESQERKEQPATEESVELKSGLNTIKEAVQTGDLNKCADADCSSQASFSLAIKRRDKKYCAGIANEADKKNCLKVLADMGVK